MADRGMSHVADVGDADTVNSQQGAVVVAFSHSMQLGYA